MVQRIALGASSRGNTSNAFDGTGLPAYAEMLLLLGAGVVVTLMHRSFHLPLHMPGHHGLEWMAILVFSRCTSRLSWAGFTVAMGAVLSSALLPNESKHVTLLAEWLTYALQGGALDLLFLAIGGARLSLPLAAVGGALVHALAPLVKQLVQPLTGEHYGSIVAGLAYPTATHLLFGATGAIAGYLCYRAMRRTGKVTDRT